MTSANLNQQIIREEGEVLEAYPDPLSPLGLSCARQGLRPEAYKKAVGFEHLDGAPWTIGVGCTGPNIKQGVVWTPEESQRHLDERVAALVCDLDAQLPWWRELEDPRQDVLVIMAYQLGLTGLLKFRTFLRLLAAGRPDLAADESLKSRWASQTPERAKRMAAQLRSGELPISNLKELSHGH